MANEVVFTGTNANDGTGDTLRGAMTLVNARFTTDRAESIARDAAEASTRAARDLEIEGQVASVAASFNIRTWATGQSYGPGTIGSLTDKRDVVLVSGVWYVAAVEHVAGASFATDLAAGKWLTTDPVQLRGDLADTGIGKGAQMIGGNEIAFGSYAAMKAYTGPRTAFRINVPGIAGQFETVPGDTTTAENGGTWFVRGDGVRVRRVYTGSIYASWFATSQDAGAAISSAMAAVGTITKATILVSAGSWIISSNVDLSNYKNITLKFENGCLIDNAGFSVVLPQNTETGTSINQVFTGAGTVVSKNKDVIPLAVPPGGWLTYSNIAVGVKALNNNTSGTNNIAIGENALSNNTKTSANIAIGNDALKNVTDGGNVVPAVGTFFAQGWANIAIGDTAGRDITTGYENLFIGAITGQRTTVGKWNTAVGPQSLILNTSGDCNTAVGSYVLTTSSGNNNTAMGWAACEVQTAGSNTVYGFVAMNANTTGSLNTAIGANTLRLTSMPQNNCTLGLGTLENATGSPDSNVAIGTYAMGSTTGAPIKSNAVGFEALLNVRGNFNNAFGSEALKAVTTGENNNALGQGAGRQISTGSANTAIGHLALSTASGSATNNTAVGANALLLAVGDGNTAIGSGALNGVTTESNCTGVGLSAQVTGSNQVQLGNASTVVYAYGAVQNRSDARDKTAIKPTALGLNFINQLKPVDYKYDFREDYGWGEKDGSKTRNRFHHGLIAQDVKEVCERLGIDFGGYQDHSVSGGKDVKSIGYTELIAPMIKAIQELEQRLMALEGNK